MRVIVHDAVKSANAPKPFVLLWESIRSAIWILLAAVLVMTGESAMARGSVTTVLDDFSTLRAWSTMRDDARMKVEYASWQMVVDRDGRSGPCLRLSFSPRTNSADIWGAFNIEEPIDGIGLWVQNVTRRPCGFATPSIVMATSPPILYPIIPRLTHVRLLASGDYRYLLEYCIRKKYQSIGMEHIMGKPHIIKSISKGMNIMKASTNNKVKGTIREAKGKIKETAGKITNNPNLEVKGKVEKTIGKIQKKAGQIEEKIGGY